MDNLADVVHHLVGGGRRVVGWALQQKCIERHWKAAWRRWGDGSTTALCFKSEGVSLLPQLQRLEHVLHVDTDWVS